MTKVLEFSIQIKCTSKRNQTVDQVIRAEYDVEGILAMILVDVEALKFYFRSAKWYWLTTLVPSRVFTITNFHGLRDSFSLTNLKASNRQSLRTLKTQNSLLRYGFDKISKSLSPDFLIFVFNCCDFSNFRDHFLLPLSTPSLLYLRQYPLKLKVYFSPHL